MLRILCAIHPSNNSVDDSVGDSFDDSVEVDSVVLFVATFESITLLFSSNSSFEHPSNNSFICNARSFTSVETYIFVPATQSVAIASINSVCKIRRRFCFRLLRQGSGN